MTKKAIVLDEQGELLIRNCVEEVLRRRYSKPILDHRDWYAKTQDVYVALVPDAGIPTCNLSSEAPGNAACQIYMVTPIAGGYGQVKNDGSYVLKPVSGLLQTVFNLNPFPIWGGGSDTGTGTEHTHIFIPVVKDKFGCWWAMQYPLPHLAKYVTPATTFGTSPSGNVVLWGGSPTYANNAYSTHIVMSSLDFTFEPHCDGSGWLWLDYNPDGYPFVIRAEHFANFISGTLAGSLSASSNVSCNITSYWEGLNPGSTLNVQDARGEFGTYPISSGTVFVAQRAVTDTINQYQFLTIQC